ncbi:DUF1868 domain-containing protein, partial [Bacillaceae bacterium SIJ1]|uniref:DUF1868 domain-containing protein n=1 Tax=Litoribacterium kuwaitense TaxID=1398745 RepID=UPI0013EADE95
TVFELLCHFNRTPEKWSEFLNIDEDLEHIDQFFAEAFKRVDMPGAFKMKPVRVRDTVVDLETWDQETAQMLQRLRDRLAEVTGAKFPNHDTYPFHISFGYRLQVLSEAEERELEACQRTLQETVLFDWGEVEMKKVDYTIFEDMSLFVPFGQVTRASLRQQKYGTTE